MWQFLDNLRRKPTHVRHQIAIGTSTALSLLIAMVWWNSWTLHPTTKEVSTQKEVTPVQTITGMFKDLKNKSTDSWDSTMGDIQYAAGQSAELAGVAESGGGTFDKNDIVYAEDINSSGSSTDSFKSTNP